jgi:hypothetical protein
MARVNPELKKTLEADGRWREFMRVRVSLRDGGMKSSDALNAAIAKVCPEYAAYGSIGGDGAKGKGRGAKKESGDAENVAKKVAKSAEIAEELAERKRANDEAGLVDADVFSGKVASSAAEEVMWVAEHLNVKVSAEDAPGALAWNLLMLCRESADFRVKFMLNIASDVVKRRTDADGEKDRLDGQAEYDILEELGGDRR